MNPMLVKPTGLRGAQVVQSGVVLTPEQAAALRDDRPAAFSHITDAYDRLAERADLVVVEGAGSPVEINLMDRDVVNLAMARHAVSRAQSAGQPGGVLLVGDIWRGGVFAHLAGTLSLMPPADRALVAGLVINRFHGDPANLAPGPALLTAHTGVPVRGVLPYRPDIRLDEEDAEELADRGGGAIDVCVLRLPSVSNFTDVSGLERVPGVGVRFADRPEAVGNPDLLVLPGAKNTLGDLRWMRSQGLDRSVVAAAERGVAVLGLCGGYQLLGEHIRDPASHDGAGGAAEGLGLLSASTDFSPRKRVRPVSGVTAGGWLLPAGLSVHGYEIHQGRTQTAAAPLLHLGGPEGACAGRVAGTYLHGLLDSAAVATALVDALRQRKGLDPLPIQVEDAGAWRDRQIDAAADLLSEHLDLTGMLPR
jgi:adenosylcobyric acid synthase